MRSFVKVRLVTCVNLFNLCKPTRLYLSIVCAGQKVEGYEQETLESLVLRNSEYLEVVRENINHPMLKKVILFYNDENSIQVCAFGQSS